MPLTSTHRFLYGDTAHSIGKRIWVVYGGHLQDWYYHNLLFGCVDIRRTIELWAYENGIQLTVTLTQDGVLDFSGNPDPHAAEQLFEGSRPRRRAKYSSRPEDITASLSEASASPEEDTTAQRARETANRAEDAAGGAGQALLNTLGKLTRFIKSKDLPNLIILDNFDSILEGLEIDQRNLSTLLSIKNIVQNDWHKNIAHNNFLIFLGTDKMRIEGLLPPKSYPKVMWREPGRPKIEEIEAALSRIAIRYGVAIHGCKPIAAILANQESTLELALWKVIGLIRQGEKEITAGRILDLPPVNEQKLQDIKRELDEMVGLDDLKEKVRSIELHAKEVRKNLLEGKSLPPDDSMHLVFAGPPGTGKTTAARIVANLFNAVGLLKKSNPMEVKFDDIASPNQEESGENMRKIIQDARGGVLFIDEAHQLGDERSPGANEIVKAIVPAAENYRRELVVILAGYADQMHTFFNRDPGLPRRFPNQGRIRFLDYTQEQLWEIFLINLRKNDFTIDISVEQRAKALLKKRSSQPNFGNAGGVRELVSEIIKRHNSGQQSDIKTISESDLPPLIKRDQKALDDAMAELDGMLGIEPVRIKIDDIKNRINYELEEEEAGRGSGSINPRPQNMRFVGPPGTGKTTMAKLISRILYALGSVNTDFLELSAGNLKGQYVGHSENNLREAIVKARGGVIFIDEAYSLTGDSFAQSIVTTLVEEIKKDENESTVFIIAGYKDKIDEFISTNSGLDRRIPAEIYFPNFSPEDCAELVRRELVRANYSYEDGLLDRVMEIAQIAIRDKQENFGNAGWVKDDLLATVLNRMMSRVSRSSLSLDDADRRKILIVDLPEIESESGATNGTCQGNVILQNWSPLPEFLHLPSRLVNAVNNAEQDIVLMIESAAFQIITFKQKGHGTATGFFVTADGVMATCAHVVRGASSMRVFCGRGRQERGAKLLMIREELDLALILVDIEPPVPFLVLGDSLALTSLAPLVVFGNAHVNPHEPGRLITARVVRNNTNNPRAFESDGAIEKGFSGGPAVNASTGEVVGIISGGYGISATELIRSEQLQYLLGNLGYDFSDNELNQE
jgi:SpoVK/Ycf46/Vps4 family AAA+-type ATPase